MNLEEKIKEEKNRVASEVERLTKENNTDTKILEELKTEYNAAIINVDEIEIDKINTEIKEVNARIKRRTDLIKALRDDNPNIQKWTLESITKWLNEKAILEEQAEEKYQELEVKHRELLKEIHEMVEDKYRVDNLNFFIKRYHEQLNTTNRKKLDTSTTSENKVLTNILPLKIEHRDIFKVK